MSYWHQDGRGRWYFDWEHLWPLIPVAACLAYHAAVAIVRAARGTN